MNRVKRNPNTIQRRACHRQVISVWMMILTGILVCQTGFIAAQTTQVLIVLSADASPYHEAETAIQKTFDSSFKTKSILLQDLANNYSESAKNIDIFAAIGTKAALWLHQKTENNSKVVFCMVSDPEIIGLHEDNKCYGISTDISLNAQFDLIKEAMPATRSIGMLYHSDIDKGKYLYQKVKESLPKGWQLNAVAINQYDSVAKAIESLLKTDPDIIWTAPDASVYNVATTRTLLLSAVRNDVPVFGFSPSFVRAGAMLGVGIKPKTQGQQAAQLIVDLVQNKNIEQHYRAPDFEIAVNLIVAEKLSVDLPNSLIDRSQYIFKTKE